MHFRQFAEQAFAIGVLLLEIGSGRFVHDISRRSKTLGQGFYLYAVKSDPPSKPTSYSGVEIHRILTVSMGDDYANSVKVCLNSKESWKKVMKHKVEDRAKVYEEVLTDYYSEVYLP